MITTTVIEHGHAVACDACNADHTAPLPSAAGGMLYGSYAICPACQPRWEASAKHNGEENMITARAAPGQSFRDFVINTLRGGKPAVTTITSF